VIAALGLNAPMSSPETMAQWLREHAPDVSVEMMYRGRPMLDQRSPTLPPTDEQIKILTEASQRYAEVYRAHGVSAIAFPAIPIVAMPIRQGGTWYGCREGCRANPTTDVSMIESDPL
jgi:hypothetical protein